MNSVAQQVRTAAAAHWCNGAVSYSPREYAAARMKGACWYSNERRFVLQIPDLASCEVSDGGVVRVQLDLRDRCFDPRLIVQGLPIAAQFVQQGLLALRGSAVSTQLGVVLIAGASGVGKTSLAAALSRSGFPIIADEVVPLELSPSGGPYVLPGMTDVLLWRDSVEHLSMDIAALAPARSDLQRYYVDVATAARTEKLHAIFVLSTHNRRDCEVTRLSGQRRIMEPTKFVFNRQLWEHPEVRMRNYVALVRSLSTVRVYRLVRPDGIWSIRELVDLIAGEVRS